ncbi:ECF transporter S component [Agathobaculum sp. Marseille-P7918]|uniref:ECF transporter S component n=1 Tax=Agathobaculum sp. Marseille-P7918 TaxID=2479843 RepID=UPI000F62D96A|nr:ECF transporter S component [Agathobaculum sp. Marseille-P7918]
MNQKKTDVKLLAQMALLVALELVLAFTPLGYIPLGFMNATTMHIPVILGACLLGPKAGAVLGAEFGITSVIRATITPNLTSFVFTPFYSFSPEFSGNWTSLIVAIVPRVLIGVIAGLVFQLVMRISHDKQALALPVAGFVGSMVNTIGVMGLIYLLFGEQYAAAGGQSFDLLLKVIMGVVAINGVPEALIAAVLTLAVGKVLISIFGRRGAKATQHGTV